MNNINHVSHNLSTRFKENMNLSVPIFFKQFGIKSTICVTINLT